MRQFIRLFTFALATSFALPSATSHAEEATGIYNAPIDVSSLSNLPSPLAEYQTNPTNPQDMSSEFDALGINDQTPQISIEIRFIEIGEDSISTFKKQPGIIWNTSTRGALPKMIPIAANKQGEGNFPVGSAAASSTTTMPRPVSTALLDDAAQKKVLDFLNSNVDTNCLQAPRVTLFSGQVATIADNTQQPFVEAVNVIKSQDQSQTAHQPLIRLFEDGVMVRLQSTADETDESKRRLRLNCDLAMSKILDVEMFTYTESGSSQEITVQIPQLKVDQAHLSKELLSGQSLLIDPFVTITETRKEKGLFNRTTTVKKRRLVMLTPVWLDLSDAVATK